MLGAGVFVALSPAAAAAGNWLVLGLALAGIVAYCNAAASAQLAQLYPASGGTYVYGRERLGSWAGFVAGWSFITGKVASCAAMALTFALYVAPGYEVPVAVAAVVVLTGVNLLGITRTALLTKVLLLVTLAVLAFVVVLSFAAPPAGSPAAPAPGSPFGALRAAGFLFFAFAGYARIATLGEEVRRPRRTIPLAILLALGIALAVYLAIALGLLHHLGSAGIAATATPLLDVGRSAGGAAFVVVIGAAAASLGSLLALITGVGRTTLAMARQRDLPPQLARIGARHSVPFPAELAVAAVVVVLLLTANVLTVVGFSSFGVLIYYSITNIAALALPERPWHAPRWLNLLGFAGCLILALTLPARSVLTMLAVLALGCAGRLLVVRLRIRRARA